MIGSQAEMKSHTALITFLVGMTSCQTETMHCENAFPAVRLYLIEAKLAPEGSLFSKIHQMMPRKDEVHLCAGGEQQFSAVCAPQSNYLGSKSDNVEGKVRIKTLRRDSGRALSGAQTPYPT